MKLERGPRLRNACVGSGLTAIVAAMPTWGAGEVLWSVPIGTGASTQFVAVAPDGRIYATSRDAIHAFTPQGIVLWNSTATPSDGVPRSVSIGKDGTIYSGMGISDGAYSLVVAFNPDGSVKWQFVPPAYGALVTGPNVGPDGNIYGVQEPQPFDGIGAFALDPDGRLLWSNVGDLPQTPSDLFFNVSDIEFGADRLHTGYVSIIVSNIPTMHTFSLGGDLLWSTVSLNPPLMNFPNVDPQDRVICTWGQTGVRALSAEGAEEWFVLHPDGASLIGRPAIGADGTIYAGDFIGIDLWALNADGTTRWVLPSTEEIFSRVAVSPDDQTLVVQGNSGAGGAFWVRGYAAGDGALLWQVDLPPENGVPQLASAYEPGFAPDSSAVYVTSQFAGGVNDYGYLYAISLTDGGNDLGDVDGDGMTGPADLGMILGGWGPCPQPPCPSDLDGDGVVGPKDLSIVLANWG